MPQLSLLMGAKNSLLSVIYALVNSMVQLLITKRWILSKRVRGNDSRKFATDLSTISHGPLNPFQHLFCLLNVNGWLAFHFPLVYLSCSRKEQQQSSHMFLVYSTGCSFTKCAREKADELGIKGWVKNSKAGTIMGKMQGTKANVETM